MRAAVIGAGASGMTAALTASGLGHEVTVFERQARVGRKLMATGNGRCNLTNTGAGADNYHGEAPDFVLPALRRFGVRDTLDFFGRLGLLTREEYGGRVYPLSNSANSVVDVLRQAMDAAGIKLVCGDRVRELSRHGSGFMLATESGEKCSFDAVVVACGGLAGEKLGGGRDGYELLRGLGHTRTALRPALVQITTEPMYPRSLKGIKADCRLRLRRGGRELAASEGEVLFTETGVSGPAAFDLSLSEAEKDEVMTYAADLLRGVRANAAEIEDVIRVNMESKWRPERLVALDKAVISLALYEGTIAKKVPVNVAISEAVEIAKAFGTEESGRFVNGVLGRIVRGSDDNKQ